MCFATSMKNNTQRESIKRIEAMENEPMEQKTHKNEGTKMVWSKPRLKLCVHSSVKSSFSRTLQSLSVEEHEKFQQWIHLSFLHV